MLDKKTTGLIVIDVQGKLARLVADSEKLIGNCEVLIKGSQILQLPVLWVEQTPDKLGSTVDELELHLSNLTPITKSTFSACLEANFLSEIKKLNIKNWLVCGIEAHICVYQTCSDLLKLGYGVHLVSDAVASRTPDNKLLAIEKLSSLGAEITATEMCLYELLQDSQSPEFKSILQLVR